MKFVSIKAVLALSVLAILERTLFFDNAEHFFQGDTLYWLANRYRSLGDFAHGFASLDPGGWYRPLSQRTVESVLFPFFELDPIPYRFVTFILFLCCTLMVFVLITSLTKRWLPAAIGTFFFATHITHAYTTYDVAFTPEILYTSFYVVSVIAWFRYLQEGRKRNAAASVAFFLGSLLSKEAAVTLPVVLTLLWLLAPVRTHHAVRWLAVHFALLGLYVGFVVGYLAVGGIDFVRWLESPGRAGVTGYELVVGRNILESFGTALRWLSGLPGGSHGNWELPAPWMVLIPHVFRWAVVAASLLSLWKGSRRLIVFGLCWFVVSASPMLPLLDHFLPYYLLAPLVGISIVVGVALSEGYERLAKYAPAVTLTAGMLLLGVYAAVSASAIWEAQRTQSLLGGSSQNAATAVADMRAMNPELPRGAILAFVNDEDPEVWWNHAQGGLFQMAYNDPTLTTMYSTWKLSIDDNDVLGGRVRYFEIRSGHIVPYAPYRVQLSKPAVAVGESYLLRVPGLTETDLQVLYTLDGRPRDGFRTHLDSNGEAEFAVTRDTPPGVYTIVAVKKTSDWAWSLTNESIDIAPSR